MKGKYCWLADLGWLKPTNEQAESWERTDTCNYEDQGWKTRANFYSFPTLPISPHPPPRDLPLLSPRAVSLSTSFDPAMATPAPATAGELLRVEPLELRFPCMPPRSLPVYSFLLGLEEKKTVFFPFFPWARIDWLLTLLGVSREQSS